MRPTAGFIVTGTAVDWCVTFRTCDRRCTVFLLLFFSSSPPPPPPFPSVCNFVRNPLSPPVCVSRRIEIEAVESYTQCASRRVINDNPCVWFVRAYFPSVVKYYNIYRVVRAKHDEYVKIGRCPGDVRLNDSVRDRIARPSRVCATYCYWLSLSTAK